MEQIADKQQERLNRLQNPITRDAHMDDIKADPLHVEGPALLTAGSDLALLYAYENERGSDPVTRKQIFEMKQKLADAMSELSEEQGGYELMMTTLTDCFNCLPYWPADSSQRWQDWIATQQNRAIKDSYLWENYDFQLRRLQPALLDVFGDDQSMIDAILDDTMQNGQYDEDPAAFWAGLQARSLQLGEDPDFISDALIGAARQADAEWAKQTLDLRSLQQYKQQHDELAYETGSHDALEAVADGVRSAIFAELHDGSSVLSFSDRREMLADLLMARAYVLQQGIVPVVRYGFPGVPRGVSYDALAEFDAVHSATSLDVQITFNGITQNGSEAVGAVYDVAREVILEAKIADDPDLERSIKEQILHIENPTVLAADPLYRYLEYRSGWAGFHTSYLGRVVSAATISASSPSGTRYMPELPRAKVAPAKLGVFDESGLEDYQNVDHKVGVNSTAVHEMLHYYSRLSRFGDSCGFVGPGGTGRWLNEAVTSRLETKIMRQVSLTTHVSGYASHRAVYDSIRRIGGIDEDVFIAAYFEQPRKNEATGRIEQPARTKLNLALREAFGPGFMKKLELVYTDKTGQFNAYATAKFVAESRLRVLSGFTDGDIDPVDLLDWAQLYTADEPGGMYTAEMRPAMELERTRLVQGFLAPTRKNRRRKKKAVDMPPSVQAVSGVRGINIVKKYQQLGATLQAAAAE